MRDFFISYNKADRAWAEWIAWQLEGVGYTTLLQAWDFRPGDNFVLKMREATAETECTIAVLSEHYLNAQYTQPEWAAAFRKDPTGEKRLLLFVRVEECKPDDMLASIVYIDFVGKDEHHAKEELLIGVKRERVKPSTPVSFPGESKGSEKKFSRFPGVLPPIWNIRFKRNLFFLAERKFLMTSITR